ncbi:DNA-binding response regulator AraC family [Vibrio ponticus]|nr:DNA-binding response regulator AraC family [Vibrio ponticus]
MWISTNKGIHYYSLFGDKFERFPSQDLSSTEPHERMNNLIAMQNKRGYWVVKDSGFYRLVLGKHKHKQLLYSGRVHNVLEHDDIVWLATDNGIVALEQKTGGKINNHPLVKQFYQQKITHLAMDSQGNIWIANSEGVWCYNAENGQAQLIAEQWMQGSQIGAQLKTILVTSDDELLLGSENGLYLLRDGQLKYFSQSEKYGAVLSMIEGDSRQIWVASNYGVNILDPARTSFSAVPLVDEHIGPQCLIGNQTGIWLTSSAGLTHFSHQGQAIAHYGQPFGLISNELRNSFCLQDASDPDTLLLVHGTV